MSALREIIACTMLVGVGGALPAFAQIGFGGLGGFGSGVADPLNVGNVAQGASPSPGVGFAPFATVYATFDHELSIGSLPTFYTRQNTYGGGATAGLSGTKMWQHTALGFAYVGTFLYTPNPTQGPAFSTRFTQNHLLALSVSKMVNSRLSLAASTFGGTSLGGYGVGSGFGGLNGSGGFGLIPSGDLNAGPGLGLGGLGSTQQNGLVDNEIGNARSNFVALTGSISYRISERWTASVSGGASILRRKGSMFGSNDEYASGQLTYRIDSRSNFGVGYQYGFYSYRNAFGDVHPQTLGVSYQRRLNGRTGLNLFVGEMQLSSTFVGTVSVDPELAALLGTSTSYAIQSVRYRSMALGASLSSVTKRQPWSVSYARGMSPGNGLLLAGVRDSLTATTSFNGLGRLSYALSASAIRDHSLVGSNFTSSTISVAAGTGYRLFGQFYWTVNGGFHRFDISSVFSGSAGLFATVGLTWTPRESHLQI